MGLRVFNRKLPLGPVLSQCSFDSQDHSKLSPKGKFREGGGGHHYTDNTSQLHETRQARCKTDTMATCSRSQAGLWEAQGPVVRVGGVRRGHRSSQRGLEGWSYHKGNALGMFSWL